MKEVPKPTSKDNEVLITGSSLAGEIEEVGSTWWQHAGGGNVWPTRGSDHM